MKTSISQALNIFEAQRLPGELVIYHKAISRDLWGSDLWLFTDQRLLRIHKGMVEEKLLFEPGEAIVFYETGEMQFSGNVHLLTSQRLLVLDIGARNYLLHLIPLRKIVEVDVTGVREGSLNTINYALKISLSGYGRVLGDPARRDLDRLNQRNPARAAAAPAAQRALSPKNLRDRRTQVRHASPKDGPKRRQHRRFLQ